MNGDELSWGTIQNLTDLIELNLKTLHKMETAHEPPKDLMIEVERRIVQLRSIRMMIEDISVGYPQQEG